MGDAPIAMVDARDVAACAVAALTRDDGDGAWHLTGPAGVTFADVAPHLGARRYVNVPTTARGGSACAGAERRRSRSTTPSAWRAYLASGADGAPTDDVRRLTGRSAAVARRSSSNDEKGS